MKRIVLFEEGRPILLLRALKHDEDGVLKGGFVENGSWIFRIKAGEFLAKDGQFIVSRRVAPKSWYEFPVPEDWRGDYNSIMNQAEEVYEKSYNVAFERRYDVRISDSRLAEG